MSFSKNKLTAAALAVCTTLVLGYSPLASAASPVDFTTSITVTSPYDCPVTASAATNSWALTWTLATLTSTSGTLTYTSAPTAPLPVLVGLDSGAAATCDLSGIKVDATASGTGVTADPTYAGVFLKTTSDGFWRYVPVLSRIQLFTAAGQTSAATGTFTVTDAAGNTHEQKTTAAYTARDEITGLSEMNDNPALSLSDNYLDSEARVPLAGAGMASIALSTAQTIKSASVGVSALIAHDPEDAAGAVDVAAVNDKDVVTLPFTVNVAYH